MALAFIVDEEGLRREDYDEPQPAFHLAYLEWLAARKASGLPYRDKEGKYLKIPGEERLKIKERLLAHE